MTSTYEGIQPLQGAGAMETLEGPKTLRGAALTDLSVLIVLTSAAGPQGCVTLGCRRIAEEVGCSKDTVARALRRLRASGAIEWIPKGRDRPTDADNWRVLRPATHTSMNPVWSRDGLGPSCRLVYEAMVPGERYSYTALQAAASLSRRQVRSALKKLESVGWVSGNHLREGVPTSRTRWTSRLVSPDEMAAVAAHLRVSERRLGRRRKHRQQRLDFYTLTEPHAVRTELMHTNA